MRKILWIIIFSCLLSKYVYADEKIILKCKKYSDDYLVIIDLDNMLFDMNLLKNGIPNNFRFKIDEVNEKNIIASAIKKTPKNEGYLKHRITITIDRYLGVINDEAELIEDTRKDKSGATFLFKEFFAKDCEIYNLEKKF